jgi:hypothetical protein
LIHISQIVWPNEDYIVVYLIFGLQPKPIKYHNTNQTNITFNRYSVNYSPISTHGPHLNMNKSIGLIKYKVRDYFKCHHQDQSLWLAN